MGLVGHNAPPANRIPLQPAEGHSRLRFKGGKGEDRLTSEAGHPFHNRLIGNANGIERNRLYKVCSNRYARCPVSVIIITETAARTVQLNKGMCDGKGGRKRDLMKCCFGVDAEGDDMGEWWYATETKSGIWRGALPFVMLGESPATLFWTDEGGEIFCRFYEAAGNGQKE